MSGATTSRISRRRFLGGLTATAAFGLAGARGGAVPSRESRDELRERATALLDRFPSFDLHAHPGVFFTRGLPDWAGDEAFAERIEDMRAGRLSGAFFATVSDLGVLEMTAEGPHASRSFEPGEAWADCLRQLAQLRDLLAAVPAEVATTPADVGRLRGEGRVAAMLACEGGDCLEARPERLQELRDAGVRSLQLVHYAPNELGDLQTHPPRFEGLSPVGREVVRETTRLGLVIDVAHASFATVRDVVAATDAPLLLSHSHLRTAEVSHPRLLTPDHARLVAETGGVIGMWPSGFANRSLDDFVDNTLRLVDLVGVDHVGLGTDMDGNYRPVIDRYGQLPDWVAALLGRGMSEEEVAKLAGGNALRVIAAVVSA